MPNFGKKVHIVEGVMSRGSGQGTRGNEYINEEGREKFFVTF